MSQELDSPKFTRKIPLGAALIIPALLQVVLVAGSIGWLSFRNGQSAVSELATRLENELAARVKQQLDVYLGTPHQLTQTNINVVQSEIQNQTAKLALERYFALALNSNPNVQQIYVGLTSGVSILASRQDEGNLIAKTTEVFPKRGFYAINVNGNRQKQIKVEPAFDPRNRPWYKLAIASKKKTWSPIYTFVQGEIGMTASQPFYDSLGNLEGVMAVDLTLIGISDFLRIAAVDKPGQIFILNRKAQLVASSTNEKPYLLGKLLLGIDSKNPITQSATKFLSAKFGKELENLNQAEQLAFGINDKKHLVQVLPYRDRFGLDFLIVLVTPESAFMTQIETNTQDTIKLSAIAAAIAMLLSLALTRWLTLPLLNMHGASEKMIKGDLDQRVDETKGADEVRLLANSFNQMAEILKTSFVRLETLNSDLEQIIEERTLELSISQDKFSKAFFSSPYPLAISTASNGVFIEVNEAFLKLSGYLLGELIGKSSLELNFWENPQERSALMQELLASSKIFQREVNFNDRLKRKQRVLLSAETIQLQAQNCVIWVAVDISDRVKAEAALKRTNSLLEAQKEVAIDGILAVDEQGRITYFNQRFCQIWGIPSALLELNTNIHWFLNALEDVVESIDELITAIEFTYDSEFEPLQHETSLKDGRVIDCYSAPLYDVKRLIGMVWYFRDISARVKAEQAEQASIRQIEKQNALLLQLTKLPALVQGDFDFAIKQITEISSQNLEISRISVWLYNSTKTNLECQDCFDFHSHQHSKGMEILGANAAEYLQMLGSERFITFGDRLNFPLPALGGVILSAPIRSLSGDMAGMVCLEYPGYDCSLEQQSFGTSLADLLGMGLEARDRQEINITLQQAKEAAEVANAAKTEFLRHMTHELRTPLNAVLGFTHLMETEPDLSSEQRENLSMISQSGKQLLNIYSNALEMSAIESGKLTLNPSHFNLLDLINQLKQNFEPKAIAKNLGFQLILDPQLPSQIYTDQKKLGQVLTYLLDNAVRFTSEGEVILKLSLKGENLDFSVSDTGLGIAPEYLEKIFYSFVRGDNDRESAAGLGLAIAQNYVRLMGGNIKVDSQLHQGSSFCFEIKMI
jgi:PAS domain S-box-containing protein